MAVCVSCGSTNLEFIGEYLYHGEKFRKFFPDLTVLSCEQCGLQQTDHASIDEQKLTDYYRHDYRKETNFVAMSKFNHRLWTERGRALARVAAQHINPLEVDKIFEIGAGYGYNLIEFQKQFESARLFADELASKLPPQHITQTNIDDGPYDIVIMSHVLEHLTYPKEFISRVVKNLRPGGLLVVEVPNEGNEEFVCQEKNGMPFHAPHIIFFTEKTLRPFFDENFKELRIKLLGTAGSTIAEEMRQRERKVKMLKRIPRRLLGIFPPLQRGAERLCELAIERDMTATLNVSNDTETFDKVFLRIVLVRE
jgi:SAM-dependent methyltransferase